MIENKTVFVQQQTLSFTLDKYKSFGWEFVSNNYVSGGMLLTFTRSTELSNIDKIYDFEKQYLKIEEVLKEFPYYYIEDRLVDKYFISSFFSILNLILFFPSLIIVVLFLNYILFVPQIIYVFLIISIYFVVNRLVKKSKYKKRIINGYKLLERIKVQARQCL